MEKDRVEGDVGEPNRLSVVAEKVKEDMKGWPTAMRERLSAEWRQRCFSLSSEGGKKPHVLKN